MRKSLIFAPHPDDDVLSFAGYILTEKSKGNYVQLEVMTCGGPNSKASYDTRFKEFTEAMKFLGVDEYSVWKPDYDGLLDTLPNSEITSHIDSVIGVVKPDNIFTCYPSTHSDHIAVYNAFQASMRLKEGHLPNLVAFGEYPFILPSLTVPTGGKLYLPMTDKVFKKKCEAFEIYKSQQKKSPSPLGIEGIRILSETRGLECGHRYAEMYYVQRIIKNMCEI